MPTRIERVFDASLTAGNPVEGTVNLPRDVAEVQISIDRLLFETAYQDKSSTVAWLEMWDAQSDRYLGGVQVPGGVFEDTGRPGTRGLWTWAKWPIPEGTRRIRFRASPEVSFTARVDVDLFFVGEVV